MFCFKSLQLTLQIVTKRLMINLAYRQLLTICN